MGIGCGGGICGITEGLGKSLGGLKLCRLLTRAKDKEAGAAQPIGNAGGERGLRPDDDKINGVFFGKGRHRTAVKDVDIRAFGDCCDTRVAGGNNQAVTLRVLFDGPSQAMFTPAAA